MLLRGKVVFGRSLIELAVEVAFFYIFPKTFFAIPKNSPYLCPCIAELYFSGGQLHIEKALLALCFFNKGNE